jgi:endo-1,3-1,4-beta-glycanase ExoK
VAKRRNYLLSVAIGSAIIAAFLLGAGGSAQAASPKRPPGAGGGGGGGGGTTGWQDNFDGNQVDTSRWTIASGQAPGRITGDHLGTYDPTHVTVTNGYLSLLLTQETGNVDGNPNGILSTGALIYTKQTYGYGTYEWRMRMSSTADTPDGPGEPISGSVSAGFNYVNNSETEIDFEFSGLYLGTLYMVNWKNPNPSTDPTDSDSTYSTMALPDITDTFHTYKFVWERKKISFYVDDVLQAVHRQHVPQAPAYFMINHWGTDSPYWGGYATIGTARYFYVDWVKYTPL